MGRHGLDRCGSGQGQEAGFFVNAVMNLEVP